MFHGTIITQTKNGTLTFNINLNNKYQSSKIKWPQQQNKDSAISNIQLWDPKHSLKSSGRSCRTTINE